MIPVFSVFSGVGGLDWGARLAGLEIAAGLDADERASAIHKQVFGAHVFQERTEDIDVYEIVRASGIPRDGSSILIGGPPCTAFSHAGFWIERKRNGRDVQAGRVHDYFKFVKEIRPRAFVMENVPGLLFRNHYEVLRKFERACSRLGYSISHAILNAADYGVPQRRRRLFVIGLRATKNSFCFPPGDFVEQPRTTGWAIGSIPSRRNRPEEDEIFRGRYAHLLPRVPPGQNYLVFTKRLGCRSPLFKWREKYWSFLLKLNPAAPSPTVPATRITNNGPFHWLNRHLRIAEIKRLQSFPDDFPVDVGNMGRSQLGNAVPPLLAAQIIWHLRKALGERRIKLPERLRIALDPTATASAVSRAISVLY